MNWSDCVSGCSVHRVGARRLAAFVEVLVPLIVLLIFFVTQSCKNHHVERAQKERKEFKSDDQISGEAVNSRLSSLNNPPVLLQSPLLQTFCWGIGKELADSSDSRLRWFMVYLYHRIDVLDKVYF